MRAIPINVMGLAKASHGNQRALYRRQPGRDNIRANGISASPIKTLAASGISGFWQAAENGLGQFAAQAQCHH